MTKDNRVCSVDFEIYNSDNKLIRKFSEQGGLILVLYYKKPGLYTYVLRNKDKVEKLVGTSFECHNCGRTSLKKEFLEKADVQKKTEKCNEIEGQINVEKTH